MTEPNRTCTICGRTKPESKFKIRKGRYVNQCKDCINDQARYDSKTDQARERNAARQRAWAARNPDKVVEKSKKDARNRKGRND